MFGYVRPCQPELKCKEDHLYKATYCGLCRTLRTRYGLLAPLFLSYDLTFLALLLEEPQTTFTPCKGRCHGNLLLKKEMSPESNALNLCADYSVILTWFKIQDSISDSKPLQKIFYTLLSFLLRKNFKKASKYHQNFAKSAENSLLRLSQLENANSPSIDETADCFALILKETIPPSLKDTNPTHYRAFQQLLYHIGRWIYLIDARDDFQDDIKANTYNPLRFRYGEQGNDTELTLTLNNSLSFARSSLPFLNLGIRTGIIENILFYGIPITQKSVFSGINKKKNRKSTYQKN